MGDDPFLPHVFGKSGDRVERTSHFECANPLKVLAFEK
jgi:hypothetical protein